MKAHAYCTLNRFAVIESDSCEIEQIKYESENDMAELAISYRIFVSCENIDGGGVALVFHNSKPYYELVRLYGFSDCNIPLEDTDTFECRTNDFIASLQTLEKYEMLTNLTFNDPNYRIFTCG